MISIGKGLLGVVGVGMLGLAGAAAAQTTAASGTVLVIPVVAETASYSSQVFIFNPNTSSITVDFKFYEAKTSTTPGLRTCAAVAVPAGQTQALALSTTCTLGPGSHHGMVILEDSASPKINAFFAYVRTQTPGGNGFSTEAFPVGNFSGQQAQVLGLKRQAASPVYQSNCFVAALGEAVDYSITLFNAAGATIGTAVTGSLQPYEMERKLDIFDAAGLHPPGDFSNVRAVINNTNGGEPAFIASCTVQESTFFGADFRIAKSLDAEDRRQKRLTCYAQSPCGTEIPAGSAGATTIGDITRKNIHTMFVAPPDYIACKLVSSRLADLEMQIRGPGGDVFLSPVFPSVPPFDSGGDGKTSFYIFTGHRNAYSAVNGNDGQTSRVFIDVSFREGGDTTVPIAYGITCTSGNGVSVPYYRASDTDSF